MCTCVGLRTDGRVQPEFITFLYQLTEGAAGRSYGLNVARLAEIPDSVLQTAVLKSRELENVVNFRRYGDTHAHAHTEQCVIQQWRGVLKNQARGVNNYKITPRTC